MIALAWYSMRQVLVAQIKVVSFMSFLVSTWVHWPDAEGLL